MKYCSKCGNELDEKVKFCPKCGNEVNKSSNTTTNTNTNSQPKSKIAAGLLAIFLGYLGIHNFYLGYTNKGITQLLLTLIGWIACGIGPIVAGLLAAVPERVLISGHTDTDPIATAQFPSNWELSSVRAMTFMKYLLAINSNLNPARFSAIGYGEYRPIAPNDNAENKQKNRRVEILIARTLSFNPNQGIYSQSDTDLVAK